MDLNKYDYELDVSITGLVNNNWLFLRFNNDTGLTSWDSALLFNPNSSALGALNIASGVYNNIANANAIYWLYSGVGVAGTDHPMTMKATYRIAGLTQSCFVIYLKQSQPVSCMPTYNNQGVYYLIFSTQIKYIYSNNHATRWAPSSIGIFSNIGSNYTSCNICIRQCIKSDSFPTHG